MEIKTFDDTAYQLFYKRTVKPNLKLGIKILDNYIDSNPLIVQKQPQSLQQQQKQQTNFNSASKITNTTSNINSNDSNALSNIIYTRGGIIEISGSSGTGKSESSLHIVTQSILPNKWLVELKNTRKELSFGGNEIGVVYFDNDYKFDILRLRDIIKLKFNHILSEQFLNQLQNNNNNQQDDNSLNLEIEYIFERFLEECFQRLYIYKCRDSLQFLHTVDALPNLIKSVGREVRDGSAQREIQMLVFDSISAFYWLDKKGESLNSRSGQLIGLDHLPQIISQYQLTVIGIKQSIFKDPFSSGSNNSNIAKPAASAIPQPKNDFLGPQWSRLVKYRVLLGAKFNLDNINTTIDNRVQMEFQSPSISITRV